ncbi:MAG TPA: glycoside hydrolase domain-containing protein [Kofleriaceae bacterium]|nr:glycoside hydrolase domain-containing protein [Kofleriaceae bacterium]
MNERVDVKGSAGKWLFSIAAGFVIAAADMAGVPAGLPVAHAQSGAGGGAPLQVESMGIVAGDAGWAAGVRHLVWTGDGGRSWTDITPAALGARALAGVFFLDERRGWAASVSDSGTDLAVWITADGGASWTSRALAVAGEGAAAISIQFADAQHGWLALQLPSSANFSRGVLLATADGGMTWKQLPPPPVAGAVRFVSPRTGWLAGGPAGDQLWVTGDGGASWRRQTVVPPATAERASAPIYQLPRFQSDRVGALTVFFAGARDAVVATYETGDAGATWRSKSAVTLVGRADVQGGAVTSTVDADTVVVAGPSAGLDVIARGAQRTAALSGAGAISPQEGIAAMEFQTASHGWLRLSSGTCLAAKSQCRQVTRLVATRDGGRTLDDITPVFSSPTGGVQIDSIRLSTGKGFDKCSIGTVSQMQGWWTNTPWIDVNVYIGGTNRGCGQPGLTSSWVNSIFNQGWRLIPTWVGLQAPGSSCTSCAKMSTSTTTARQQGINEANAAADTAASLGIAAPSIIYFDMERYDPTSHPAARAFVNAWVERLAQRGYQAGVYGAGINAANDWAPIAHPPQAVWIANWNGNQSVFNLTGLPNSLWANHQRIHQFQGPHNETWGGVTFNIDSDRADGPVADN